MGEIVTTVLPLTGELGLVGIHQQDKTIRFEKKLPLLLLAVLCFSIFLRPMVLSTNTYWTIAPNFFFRATDAGGNIDFGTQATSTGWFWSGSLIYFQNIFVTGSSYTWSTMGFSCSSNAVMRIDQTNRKDIHYNVEANAGQTSITMINIPSGNSVSKISGATSYSVTGNTITVNVLHTSDKDIIIYLDVAGPFDTLRQMWGDLFLLIVLCSAIAFANSSLTGDGGNLVRTIMSLVVGTAVLFIMLAVVENLG